MADDWEQRVYAHYVSTGGLVAQPDPKQLFGPSRPYIEQVIARHIPAAQSTRVLELACGPAPFLYHLKQRGYNYLHGVDASPEQVALAHALGLAEEVEAGDLLDFLQAAEARSYDVIILFDILEHLPPAEQFRVMDAVHATLKPGGIAIMHVPNGESMGGVRVLYGDITHKTAFTRRSMEQLLRTVGFTQVRCYEDKPIPHGFFSSLRRIIWEALTFAQMVFSAVETGLLRRSHYILSRNMLVVVQKI